MIFISNTVNNLLSNKVFTSTIRLYNCLNKILRYISIVSKQLLRILRQAITTITEGWIVIMSTNTWIKANTTNNLRSIKITRFCIRIKLIEISHT